MGFQAISEFSGLDFNMNNIYLFKVLINVLQENNTFAVHLTHVISLWAKGF